MALLSISAAARAAGKDRGTIKRYIKDGRLSCVVDASGSPKIDTSELMRVFGVLTSDGSADGASEVPQHAPAKTPPYTSLQLTIETLREQLRAAQEREEWLKKQLEAEQARSRDLERRMLPGPEARKKGIFARLFGR